MKQIYILLVIIFLISVFLSFKYQKRENFVIFNDERLNLLYFEKNIINDSDKGVLTKCEKKNGWNNPGFTVLRTIITNGTSAGK